MVPMTVQELYGSLSVQQRYDVFSALRGPDGANSDLNNRIKNDTTSIIRARVASALGINSSMAAIRYADQIFVLGQPGYNASSIDVAVCNQWSHFYSHVVAAARALSIPIFTLTVQGWRERYGA